LGVPLAAAYFRAPASQARESARRSGRPSLRLGLSASVAASGDCAYGAPPVRPNALAKSGRCPIARAAPKADAAPDAKARLAAIRTTGYTNAPRLEVTVQDAAQFFKVLADDARLKMLWLLFHHKELCVCDLMAALEITQSKASRHLSTLRHAKLVTDRKDGLWSYYALCRPVDALAREHLALLKRTLAARPDAPALLAGLDRWLKSKNRGAVSQQKNACAAARMPTRRRR
jgi:ArsR family transcriptional regulator